MAASKIHIGTSGFSYSDWKNGVFYPEGLASSEWLSYYAKHFDITELNNSFYRLPRAQTVLNWAAKVPKKFRFCPKMSSYLTHNKRLLEPEEPLERFFDVFSAIKKQLGPILIQLPPSLQFDYYRAEYFYKQLHHYKGYDFAMEARHNSWLQQDSLDLMAKYKISFVISQSGRGFPYAEAVTAKNIYVRFHGPKELYSSSYSDEMLKEYAVKFKRWIKEGHTVWVFFNNTMRGVGARNAKTLEGMMK